MEGWGIAGEGPGGGPWGLQLIEIGSSQGQGGQGVRGQEDSGSRDKEFENQFDLSKPISYDISNDVIDSGCVSVLIWAHIVQYQY